MLLVEIFLLFVLVYDKVGVNAETKLQNLRGVTDVGKNSNYLQFPESENPISGQPPLIRPNTKSCAVPLFHNVSLYYYSEVVSNKFQLPAACPPSQWNTIILSVSSFEQGTQYDRVGGLWVNDQELLRTTTPEPTSAGINWFIEKDITIYGNYFASQAAATSNQSLTAYVSIPNNVDSTYTGIIYLDASITFYLADDSGDYPAQSHLPIVLPLTKAPTTTTDLFSAMQVTGEQELKYNFTLPTNKNADWVSLIADIYASGHGCEEFYYSNLPSVNASDFGFCGGGIYREVQVFIDDAFAGSVLPFPVIYTGGVNPFLWRPLTGIMSFDIPSHRLDLTPFLGYLYDGKQHSISISVYGNNVDGFWYLDASLLLTRPKPDQKTSHLALGAVNSLPYIEDTGVQIIENTWIRDLKMIFKEEPNFFANEEVKNKLSQKYFHYQNQVQQGHKRDHLQEFTLRFFTYGTHRYTILGNIIYTDETTLKYQVEGRQQTENSNSIIGTSLTRTFQNSSCITESKVITPDGSTYTQAIASFYPLYLEDYYAEDATSFDMQATVAYAYDRLERWTYQPSQLNSPQMFSFELAWRNHMLSNATYNRTTDHTTVYKESDSAVEVFDISNKYTIHSKNGKPFLEANQLRDSFGADLYRNFVPHLLEWQPRSLSSSENVDAAESCFHRSLTAKDGSITSQNMNGTCSLPAGMTFCGYGVCGAYNAVPLQQVKQERRRINRFPVKHETTDNRPLVGHSISSPSPMKPLVERTVRLRNHKKSHHRRSRRH